MVLMATVTNFENVSHPSKTDLRQFAELFMPLFTASTEEAKREEQQAREELDEEVKKARENLEQAQEELKQELGKISTPEQARQQASERQQQLQQQQEQ